MEPQEGHTFGKYRILRKTAETRMSMVWTADDSTRGHIALKTVRMRGDGDAEAAEWGATLQKYLGNTDKRIVPVFEIERIGKYVCIPMEQLAGADLVDYIGRHIPIRAAVRIAREICEMLVQFSEFRGTVLGKDVRGAVHGDLKPANIRIIGNLAGDFEIRLLDFGTAKGIAEMGRSGTRAHAYTIAYASPDLLHSDYMNAASDLWALGVTFYETLCGRLPFGTSGATDEELNQAIRNAGDPPADPTQDERLNAIVRRWLDPNPARRYPSAREALADLRAYEAGAPVQHATAAGAPAGYRGPTMPAGSAAPAAGYTGATMPVARTATAAQAASPRTGRPRLSRRAALLLIAAAALSGAWAWRQYAAVRDAGTLRELIVSGEIETEQAIAEYRALSKRRFAAVPLSRIGTLLAEKSLTAGDAIVTRFQRGPVYNKEWQRAIQHYRDAFVFDSSPEVQGRILLCEAHVARTRGQTPEDFEEVVRQFEKAGKLLPNSPDPPLGKAMALLYDLVDPGKGERALEEARRRNYDFTAYPRWIEHVASAYVKHAVKLRNEAVAISGTLPQQAVERLQTAGRELQTAEEWYAKIPTYGKSLENIERSRSWRAIVEADIATFSTPAPTP